MAGVNEQNLELVEAESVSKQTEDNAECAVTPVDRNWQIGKPLGPCLLTLFDQQLWTDVCFTFPEDDKMREIKAHKNILASRSPVFEAMFYGSMADTSQKIEIKDISVETFQDVMQFLYSDELKAGVHRLICALSGANRYQIFTLEEYCCQCLTEKIKTENVLNIFECALFLEKWKLVYKCTNFIDDNAKNIFKLEGFLNISHRALQFLLEGNTFYIAEGEILDKVTEWAKYQCSRKDLAMSTINMREVLGDAIRQIRLLTVDLPIFNSIIIKNELFSDTKKEEIRNFLEKGQNVREISLLSNPRVQKYETVAIDISGESPSLVKTCKETFFIQPGRIIILDRLQLHSLCTTTSLNRNNLSMFGSIIQEIGCISYIISLDCANFHFEKRLTKEKGDVIDVMLDNKPLLLVGYKYEFKLTLSCVSYGQNIEAAHGNRFLHTDLLSLSTGGYKLLKSMQIQSLSGRREVNDWELEGCVDLLKSMTADQIAATIVTKNQSMPTTSGPSAPQIGGFAFGK